MKQQRSIYYNFTTSATVIKPEARTTSLLIKATAHAGTGCTSCAKSGFYLLGAGAGGSSTQVIQLPPKMFFANCTFKW